MTVALSSMSRALPAPKSTPSSAMAVSRRTTRASTVRGGLSAPALTAKDMDDIKTAAAIGVDYVAISFPKSAADMYMARQLMRAAGGRALTIAKIERVEAVAALEEILDASDGVMWLPAATLPSRSATPPCRRCRSG